MMDNVVGSFIEVDAFKLLLVRWAGIWRSWSGTWLLPPTMAETDPLLLLRQAISTRKTIKFVDASDQPTSSLSTAASLVLPQPSSSTPTTLAKSTPTRLRKPNHTQTDPNTHPSDFYALDAVYLAWSLREAASAEYMKTVREAGIGITNMVAITEKASVVDWLEGRVETIPNIVPLLGKSALPVGRVI